MSNVSNSSLMLTFIYSYMFTEISCLVVKLLAKCLGTTAVYTQPDMRKQDSENCGMFATAVASGFAMRCPSLNRLPES
jgi:hypothetical protein